MGKKRKIDYVLMECKDKRLVFRFYPRQSSCHSFGNNPPASWKDVYKVYYNYAIIKQFKLNEENNWESEVVFNSQCDECSILDEVGERCKLLGAGKETWTVRNEDGKEHTFSLCNNKIHPFGDGIEWEIHRYKSWNEETFYEFLLFDSNDIGFRFYLKGVDVSKFGEYLIECCEYMLRHGDPI